MSCQGTSNTHNTAKATTTVQVNGTLELVRVSLSIVYTACELYIFSSEPNLNLGIQWGCFPFRFLSLLENNEAMV